MVPRLRDFRQSLGKWQLCCECQDPHLVNALLITRSTDIEPCTKVKEWNSMMLVPIFFTCLFASLSIKVLLYDFFTDSPATATDWRALRHAQRNGGSFDERRHSIIQTELKSLYVGLTRARERVWIWDRSRKGSDFEASWVTSPLVNSIERISRLYSSGCT